MIFIGTLEYIKKDSRPDFIKSDGCLLTEYRLFIQLCVTLI